MSQEECARLRESVPYVKVYGYNPKHLYPKLNSYGDNVQRKVQSSCSSTYCTCSVCLLFAFVLEVVLIQNNVTEINYCFIFLSKQSILSINVIIFISLCTGKEMDYVTKLCTCYRFEEQHGFISGARQVFERAVEFFGEESMDEKLFIAFAKFEEGQREVHVDYCHTDSSHTTQQYFVIFSVFFLIVLAENLCT